MMVGVRTFCMTVPHALCGVHLLRKITFLEEEQQQAWAGELKAVLLDMKAATEDASIQGMHQLHLLKFADWKAHFLEVLVQGEVLNPVA
jgi:hypothetical protein